MQMSAVLWAEWTRVATLVLAVREEIPILADLLLFTDHFYYLAWQLFREFAAVITNQESEIGQRQQHCNDSSASVPFSSVGIMPSNPMTSVIASRSANNNTNTDLILISNNKI